MEDVLDAISRREARAASTTCSEFYFGNGRRPGPEAAARQRRSSEIDAREMSRFPLGKPAAGRHREEVFVRVGKFGPFLEQGERKASIPAGHAARRTDAGEGARDARPGRASATSRWASDPDTQQAGLSEAGPLWALRAAWRAADDEEKPKNASLLPGMKPADVTLEMALKLLSLPRTLGRASAVERADRRLQRQVRAVHQVRQRNALAAGGRVADRRDARAGPRAAGPAQAARPRPGRAARSRSRRSKPRPSPASRSSCSKAATAPT